MDTCEQAPLRLAKMQDHQLLTLHWRWFSGWGKEHPSTCLQYKGCQCNRKWQCSTIVNILQWTVGYLNVTINTKPQTQNGTFDPMGRGKPGDTRGLMGTGPGLVLHNAAGRVFGWFWKWTELVFQSKPGPQAGYPYPLRTLEMGSAVFLCKYLGCKPSNSEHWMLWLSQCSVCGTGDIQGGDGIASMSGTPVSFRLQGISGCCSVPCWQSRKPSVEISQTMAGCLSIPALACLYPGNKTPQFISSRTLVGLFFMMYCQLSLTVRENTHLAILATYNARRMSDCSSCKWPYCFLIVADIMKTYMKLVGASKYEIRLLPLPYRFP